MTQDQPLVAVQEALKKCFPVVEEQQGLWQSALLDCQPLLVSLSNLAEQLQAAQNLRFEDMPALRTFPDLKERLRRKQLAAGDIVLDKLGERLAILLKVRDTVSSHVERVFQIYEQHADTVGIDAVLQSSAHISFSFEQSLTSRKVPEEKVSSFFYPVGRLGKHPSFAQGLGPNFKR
uniref:ribosome biogenesis protein C1orf109 homolog isoform X3 n=1 Tax=Callithrix jacchus TaxID=9483 RepID=UPI0023DCF9C0|nr:ribosome biogenesis protein C1orf109 homolog isoform X3 [Callithrix jacchus]